MLAHAFVHLISNSLRFAREGVPLHIAISAEPSASSVRLRVADNGRGIPRQYQDKIFGVFATLEPRAKSHTGIGLAIVAKIVERMHGQIAVESEPGQGTTFIMDLPARARLPGQIRRPDEAMSVAINHANQG
jgi:signal transduction histidine kinase